LTCRVLFVLLDKQEAKSQVICSTRLGREDGADRNIHRYIKENKQCLEHATEMTKVSGFEAQCHVERRLRIVLRSKGF